MSKQHKFDFFQKHSNPGHFQILERDLSLNCCHILPDFYIIEMWRHNSVLEEEGPNKIQLPVTSHRDMAEHAD